MTSATPETHKVLVDTILLISKERTVFSGPNQDDKRVRVRVDERLYLVVGELYEVVGGWEEYEHHDSKDHQLRAVSCRRTELSGRLIIPFLQAKLKGFGPARAARLYRAFQGDLAEVLSDPKRVMEVARATTENGDVTEYSIKLAINAHYEWGGQEAEFEVLRWMEERGIDNFSSGRLIARILGNRAPDILDKNPYILAAQLSWYRMDKIGLPILRSNPAISAHYRAPERLLGAIDSSMRSFIAKGHTAVDKDRFRKSLAKKIKQSDEVIDEAIRLAELNGALICGGDLWRAPGCCYMENIISSRIEFVGLGKESTSLRSLTPDKVRRVLDNSMARKGISLHPEQQAAVQKALENQICILTGGAGTGKTTVVNFIADVWEHMGGRVELTALAGKATLRMSQATSRLARTIFRTLKGLERRAEGHTGPDLPLLDDKTLLIVDESSMVDLAQWFQIFDAMPLGCRILMVGDVAQLPPIGFGLVFQMLAERQDISCHLEKIHRQTDSSGIPAVAAAIRERSIPSFSHYSGIGHGVSFIDVETKGVRGVVEKVVEDLGGLIDNDDLMICTALNGTDIGVEGINNKFSIEHTKRTDLEPVKGFLGNYFLPNDPVVHLRNIYSEGLYNGSMGRVIDIDHNKRKVTARFDDVEKDFSGPDLFDLKLAYAITCHKAQGSQAKRAIIPICDTSRLDPTWLYTAVTRAEEQCVLIGEARLLEAALKRSPAHKERVIGFR
jgi:exodeoxyribonuclease V alpha subunit